MKTQAKELVSGEEADSVKQTEELVSGEEADSVKREAKDHRSRKSGF